MTTTTFAGSRACALAFALAPMFAAGAGLPTLPEAFGRGTPGAGAVAEGNGLLRVAWPGERYPEARCADGSPVALYARRATDPAHRDDWIVYLQGGGSCDGGQDCRDRWLGRDGNFGANKLSSRYAPALGIVAGGIANPRADNPFGGWNHVFAYYCSSDGWAGTAADIEAEALHEGEVVRYRLHQLGARIVDAMFDHLRSGEASYSANGARVTLPDLDAARQLVFAGSSAGGSGVRTNVDRIGAKLRAARGCADGDAGCGARYAALIDASYGLATEGLGHAGSRACGAGAEATCTYAQAMQQRWFGIVLGFRRGVADDSCVAYHEPHAEAWRCADGAHVLAHHVSTPFFVRADLEDRLVAGNTVEAGYTHDGVALDRTTYGLLEELQLLSLPSIGERSEEPRTPGPLEPPGVFGPQCRDHETLRSNDATYGRAIVADGLAWTLPEVFANWLDGAAPQALVERYDPAGPPRSCALARD